MSVGDKLVNRFLGRPKDFTYEELKRILGKFGYVEQRGGNTNGSSRKFSKPDKKIIHLHEPHPKPFLKRYQIDNIIGTLIENGDINEK